MAFVVACIISYNGGKSTTYTNFIEYYNKTETLLDTIHNQNEVFADGLMETDVYYEYEVARENAFKLQ